MTELANVRSQRRAAVSIGTAPDGVRWRLLIDRGAPAAELLAPIAAKLGYQNAGQYRGLPFADVVSQVNGLLEQRDIQSIDTGRSRVDCYVTGQTVAAIAGTTLLSRFLSQVARTFPAAALADTRNFPGAAPPSQPPTAVPAAPPPLVVPETGTGHLALPLDGSRPLVVRRVEKPGAAPAFALLRPFQPESLAALQTARFDLRFPSTGERLEGSMADAAAYQRARRQAIRSRQSYTSACRVDRAELVQRAAELADCLYREHQAGLVHGDFKPANILIAETGVQVIDSLKLAPGSRSPAMTPGWAAPEQIAGGEVSCATDQYALGLLLCELLQGVRYGEEVNFVVPVGGRKTERFTLLRNPGVYLAPDSGAVDPAAIEAWRRFLDRCLRFLPGERFSSMAELAGELRQVASGGSVRGQLEASGSVRGQIEASGTVPAQLGATSTLPAQLEATSTLPAQLEATSTVRGQLEITPWFGALEEDEESSQPVWQVWDVRS